MAAPHLPDPVAPGVPARSAAVDRSAQLADLADRLAGLPAAQPRPPGAAPQARQPPAAGGRSRADATGRPRVRADAPGHPEDDPGDPYTVAREICLRLLTAAARPRAGLAEALRRRGIPADVTETVLDRLTEVGLIDDRAYSEGYVTAKHRDRGLGAAALQAELRRKGIEPHVASAAAAAVDSDAERGRAQAFISRRVDAAMAAGPAAARRRLVGLLARRGYGVDVAVAVVDEALAAYAADDDR